MTESRQRNLYWTVAVLVVLRFGVVPWVAWQDAQHDALAVLTKRLDRSVGVIENRAAIEKSAKDLAASLAAFRAKFRESDSVEGFKLASQQEISTLVSQAGSRVTLFDWVIDKFDDQPPLARVRARIQLAGPIQVLATVQGRLETRFPSMVIRDVRVEPQNPTNTPNSTFGTMNLVADIYFRQAAKGSAP